MSHASPNASNANAHHSGRYTIGDKLGQGGMSIVYPARDTILHRAVAVKVLKKERATSEQAVRRFLDEARITGQLQHPGVPPIHDLGSFEDGRPFLAMKLIKGDTLEQLLRARKTGRVERAIDLLQVFEQVAQTVAFAHSKRVINRDLKPANIMVGAFGEVQVLDWGLAKVLSDGVDSGADSTQPDQTFSLIDMGGDGGSNTLDGTALGTPAYMPPEQARGEIHRTDERADVFTLGGILCAILTGQPPYTGANAQTVLYRARAADLGETFARLDACDADAELVALAKHCLKEDPEQRPADALAVANVVAAHRIGVAERLRSSELERAAALTRIAEQRKKRRVQLALAATIGMILLGGAGFAWYRADRRAERVQAEAKHIQLDGERKAVEARAAVEREFQEQTTRRAIDDSLALALRLRKQYRFREAADAVEQAKKLAAGGLVPDLTPSVDRAAAELAFVAELDGIRMKRTLWHAASDGTIRYEVATSPAAFQAALLAHGFNVGTENPTALAGRIAASPLKAELLAALDDWAVLEPDEVLRNRVLAVARRADPGPWLDRFRDPAVRKDKVALAELALAARPEELAPAVICALSELMKRHKLDPATLLTTSQLIHPTDFLIAYTLARRYFEVTDTNPQRERETRIKAIAYYRLARALRPDSATMLLDLGAELAYVRNVDGAITCFREAGRLDPSSAAAFSNLGLALKQKGKLAEAETALRTAVRLDPDLANARNNLGLVLREKGDRAGAFREYRAALAINPKFALAHANLGVLLVDSGDFDGGIKEYRIAIELDPNNYETHNNMGVALSQQKKLVEAELVLRRAIEIDETDGDAHVNLAIVLMGRKRYDEAEVEYLRAIELNPKDDGAYSNYGVLLVRSGNPDAGVEQFRIAVQLNPDNENAQFNLSNALKMRGQRDRSLVDLFGIALPPPNDP